MAWNNDDWVWVADSPNGGIYQNKYNPSLYANASGGVGSKEDIMGSGGGSYTQGVDYDGSITGVPGATYQKSPTGAVSIISRPSSGGSSPSPTNVYINQNPGALYTDRTSDGTDGYPAGTVLQTNNVTGAETVKYKPPAAAASLYNDVDGDGYDDQTGRIAGSYLLGGDLYYQGQRINPDGSPYSGGAGKPDASTWTGYGPKGQGTYYLDGPGGTPGTYIGATTAAGAGASSGSLGGGSTSRALSAAEQAALDKNATANNIAQIQAEAAARVATARDQAEIDKIRDQERAAIAAEAAKADREFKAGESALDRALRAAETAQSMQQRAEDRRLAAVDTYGKGLTAYDATAYFDALDAAGYDINNLLRGGTNLLTDKALTQSAAALGIIRDNQAASSGLPTVPGGSPASGVPGAPSAPGTPPVASSGLGNVAGNDNPGNFTRGQDVQAMMDASAAKSADRYARQIMLEAKRYLSTLPVEPEMTPEQIRAAEYQYGVNRNIERGAAQSMYPGFGNYVPLSTAPQSGAGPIGIPLARDVSTDYRPDTQDPNKVVYAARGLRRGGGMPLPDGREAAVVGDLQHPSQRGNPEMVVGDNLEVMPLNMMGRQGRQIMRGLPHMAWGTDALGQMTWTNDGDIAPTEQVASGMDWSSWQPPSTKQAEPTYATTAPVAQAAQQPVQKTYAAVPPSLIAAQTLRTPNQQMTPTSTAPVVTSGLPTAPQPAQPVAQPVALQSAPVAQQTQANTTSSPTYVPGAPVANPGQIGSMPNPMQPVASSGLPVTPQPDQALLDEVAKQRRDTILMGGPGMYNLKFGGMSDLYKRTYAQNQAQKYGIPEEEILFQAQKARQGLGGTSSSGLSRLGY